jgi:hypothetical protein
MQIDLRHLSSFGHGFASQDKPARVLLGSKENFEIHLHLHGGAGRRGAEVPLTHTVLASLENDMQDDFYYTP